VRTGPEDQRQQVTLLLGQRRKRIYHLLDVSSQFGFIVAACGGASAVLARPCPRNRKASLARVDGGTSRKALTLSRTIVLAKA
jgi:hypothetical protein